MQSTIPFIEASSIGNLEQVIEFTPIKDEEYEKNIVTAQLQAFTNGHYEVFAYLLKQFRAPRNTGLYDYMWQVATKQGHIKIAQLLHSECSNLINEFSFKECLDGGKTVLSWAHSAGIISKSELARYFKQICMNGTPDMAQFFVDLDADLLLKINESFVIACKSENFDVANFLQTIQPNLLIKNIRSVGIVDDQKLTRLGVDSECAVLLKCIVLNEPFPEVSDIDDEIINALVLLNMIDHLKQLRKQFQFINFETKYDNTIFGSCEVITDFCINRYSPKNALSC